MNEHDSLVDLMQTVHTSKGLSANMQSAQNVKMFLWATYDPHDDLIYPTIEGWDNLLAEAIKVDSYDTMSKDEVLSILFGLLHRNRMVEGLWWSMFERGVTRELLERLQALSTE